jgi:hypothetical protein
MAHGQLVSIVIFFLFARFPLLLARLLAGFVGALVARRSEMLAVLAETFSLGRSLGGIFLRLLVLARLSHGRQSARPVIRSRRSRP